MWHSHGRCRLGAARAFLVLVLVLVNRNRTLSPGCRRPQLCPFPGGGLRRAQSSRAWATHPVWHSRPRLRSLRRHNSTPSRRRQRDNRAAWRATYGVSSAWRQLNRPPSDLELRAERPRRGRCGWRPGDPGLAPWAMLIRPSRRTEDESPRHRSLGDDALHTALHSVGTHARPVPLACDLRQACSYRESHPR